MSWTVQEDHNSSYGHSMEPNLEDLLQKVVGDDDYDRPTNQSSQPFGQPSMSYTKSSTVFTPAPLNTADLQTTPVKDPLESFNSWVRTQTPTSSRNSPTPTGGYLAATSNATSPPSAARHGLPPMQPTASPFYQGTPQKHGGSLPSSDSQGTLYSASPINQTVGAGGPHGRGGFGRNSQLETIMEHRKHLLLQMEELALQEMELRGATGGGAAGVHPPTPPHFAGYSDWPNAAASPYQPGGAGGAGGNGLAHPFSNGITAENIRGRVYETAKDQHGCRFLQRWLDTNYDGEAAQVVMSEIIPHVAELMTDQYANFLVQKLFDIMPHDVRYNVAQVAAPHIAQIALTPHGTFSVQKLIETIATREEMEIVRESLSHDVVRLVKDVHGNHVIQKVLQRFDHPDKEFIYEAVATDCAVIATNKQGCCVLQRCLEFASPNQHKALVACILQCCLQIVQDPFGNYVLQYVLDSNDSSINDGIAVVFLPHLVPLCMNKFSSNVMEKVLRGASLSIRDTYFDTMRNPEIIASLIQDDFGNYVLQTALTMCSPAQAEGLISVIRPMMPMIKNAPYAKKLEAKMDLILKKKSLHSPQRTGGYMPRSMEAAGGFGNPHHSHHHNGGGDMPPHHSVGGRGGGNYRHHHNQHNAFRGPPPQQQQQQATSPWHNSGM